MHAPQWASPVHVSPTSLETPVPIAFQADSLVYMPSLFVAPSRSCTFGQCHVVRSPTARRRMAARGGRGDRDGGCYLTKPSAFSVSCTAGLAPTRAMKALMFGHLARSILCMPVQLSTVYR